MGYVEIGREDSRLSQQQRWGHYLTIILAMVLLGFGLNMRNNTVYAVSPYIDNQAGIRAAYPRNWLLDTQGDYVFRVRNTTQRGFGSRIQVAIQPINVDSPSERNVLDNLSLNRAQTLTEYTIGEIGSNVDRPQYMLLNDAEFTFMEYTYVYTLTDPFLDTIPIVVRGIDILTIRGSQAIIMTFQASADSYDVDISYFQQFLDTVEF